MTTVNTSTKNTLKVFVVHFKNYFQLFYYIVMLTITKIHSE